MGSRVRGTRCFGLAVAFAMALAPAAGASSGGATYSPQPTVASVACVSNCAPKKRIQGGSTAKITGQNLSGVTQVVFQGSGSKGAAKTATVKAKSSKAVTVAVPLSAQTGPVKAVASGGVQSA